MAGSVWNRNSWHWEEKNYNKWGESYIKSKLINLKIEKDNLTIYFDNIDISGNTCVSIRKGKQISSFEYIIKFRWLSSMKTDSKEHSGNIEILDFSNCSLEDNDYEINIEKDSDNEKSRKIYDILKKEGKQKIKDTLKNFPEDLLKHDKNESSKELMIKQAEEEKLKNIEILNRDEKKNENLIENLNKDINCEKKEGSIWNINNYHWEEKCLTKWAKEELKNTLENSSIELSNNIFLQFFYSEVEGEASSSLRKKKKILIYDLKINSEWKAYKKNKNNEIEIETKGHISINEIISDFSCDDENKYKYSFIFDNNTPEHKNINDVVKSEGPNEINKIIDLFISKMKEK
ncbi:activator of Hsp90 ATPase, putative [Plasmodium gallinaceum]|uniref:Activator of Hsp90 ATPase, putative n=1 Tax=Plasmodium gallinaceum TaxID=5849 RepID=A0A1J1GVH5_PLAGA|nr:activator of Hsp90 ATPase, putative [Plasmodium gallinaceum]CRG95290.1 activator of Hsp90 ATPase, putative [Plasmodium gallinaceum]